jgi:2'-5' RNA ligase
MAVLFYAIGRLLGLRKQEGTGMNGVVSLLDATHDQAVRDLWAELAERFALTGISITPYPHFSYHVAQGYDDAQLEDLLSGMARKQEPFRVRATGLGVFTGQVPVLYLPVVCTHQLLMLHAELWRAITPITRGAVAYYQPTLWVPHITLAHGDLTSANLSLVMDLLSSRTFDWDISIDNFATLYATGPRHELRSRFAFGR